MARKRLTRIVLVVVLILLAVSAWYIMNRRSAPPEPKALAGLTSPTVKGVVLAASPFTESVSLTGSVLANEMVEIRSEVSGRVTAIKFAEGSLVKKGQVLITLDDADLKAQLSRLKAQLVLDKNRFERQQQLRKIDGVSLEDFEAAQAQLAVREAEISELEIEISKTKIEAPFSGKVGLRNISMGAVITQQTLITTVTDVNTLKLDFSAPERFKSGIGVGGVVEFKIRNLQGSETFHAKIYAIEPSVDGQTRSMNIRAEIQNTHASKSALLPGMFAEVQLTLSQIPDALLVPSEAIQPSMSGNTVFVVNGGKVRQTAVEIGGRNATSVRLVSGVTIADTIAVTGLLILKDGMPVKVELK